MQDQLYSGWLYSGSLYAGHPEHAERGFAKLMELLDDTLRSPLPT
jgi:hypothetical protein